MSKIGEEEYRESGRGSDGPEPQETENERLYREAVEAITRLFGDQSVSVDDCRENLENLIDETRTMLDSLPE